MRFSQRLHIIPQDDGFVKGFLKYFLEYLMFFCVIKCLGLLLFKLPIWLAQVRENVVILS